MELAPELSSYINIKRLEGEFPEQACTKLFNSPEWLQLLQAYYGYSFWQTEHHKSKLTVAEAECIVGKKLVGLPFTDHLVPDVPAANLAPHIEILHAAFPACPVMLKLPESYAKPRELSFLGKPVAKSCLHEIPVDATPEKGMSRAFRRRVKQAVDNGLKTSVHSSTSALRVFYYHYYHNFVEERGVMPAPFAFFQALHQKFIKADKGFYISSSYKGKVLAIGVVLKCGDTYYLLWNGINTKLAALKGHYLMVCNLLHKAYEQGAGFVNLGASEPHEPKAVTNFKAAAGGLSQNIYTYRTVPPEYPQLVDKKMQQLIGQMAQLVVQHRLADHHTQAFSNLLFPMMI